jgi:hypothetical protein
MIFLSTVGGCTVNRQLAESISTFRQQEKMYIAEGANGDYKTGINDFTNFNGH